MMYFCTTYFTFSSSIFFMVHRGTLVKELHMLLFFYLALSAYQLKEAEVEFLNVQIRWGFWA